MRKLKLVCPNCGSNDTRQWNRRDTKIFDDDHYETMKREFGNNVDCNNSFIAECICDNCNHYFNAKVIINVEVVGIEYQKGDLD
ncbi:MAG: hypothetical protein M0P49_05235 [Bacilli bacterium]|nr:hypothetical protein [Bacilli bacterium]